MIREERLAVATAPPQDADQVDFFGRPRLGRAAGVGGSTGSVCAGLILSRETQSDLSPKSSL